MAPLLGRGVPDVVRVIGTDVASSLATFGRSAEMRAGVLGLGVLVSICLLSAVGCEDEESGGDLGCSDGGVAYCATTDDGRESIELCVLNAGGPNFREFQEFCEEGEVCVNVQEPDPGANCVLDPGSSCAEIDIPGEPNLTGALSISPTVATFDDFVTVTVGVDGDTREVTVILRNSNSDIVGGTGFATTGGNETLPVDVLVGTVADPGPHVVDLELRADASNRADYVLYASGDGDNYVRVNIENDVPGPETETTCLELNCDIQF